MTDKIGENKKILLKLNKNLNYLKNNTENYSLPKFCYELNYMNKNLEQNLPLNDSMFRKDIKLLEEGNDLDKAQSYKIKYEEKHRKELNNDNHQILFFNELSEETEEKYYIPNGNYWKLKN